MSWQATSYWTIRCDGDTTRGQCSALLRTPDESCTGFDTYGEPRRLPVLFTDEPSSATRLSARFMREYGWLAAGERVLCPDHVAAAEQQAEAELCGLPFEL